MYWPFDIIESPYFVHVLCNVIITLQLCISKVKMNYIL